MGWHGRYSELGSVKGSAKNKGVLRERRLLKRADAERRNALTPPKRRAAYRRSLEACSAGDQ